jgi:hypothetical protein
LGKILTIASVKRNITLGNSCCICKFNSESIDNFLLRCFVVRELWLLIFALLGVHWFMPLKAIEEYFSQKGMFWWYITSCTCNFIPLCLTWAIWRERNNRSFNGVELLGLRWIPIS